MLTLIALSALAAGAGATPGATPDTRPRTPIMSMGLLESALEVDPDEPAGTGGAINAAVWLQTREMPKIMECRRAILALIDGWAETHRLTVVEMKVTPAYAIRYFRDAETKALLEFTYWVRDKPKRARVTVNRLQDDGTTTAPEFDPQLNARLALDQLSRDLGKAMGCGT